jgi:uncharacterized membrane protein YccC
MARVVSSGQRAARSLLRSIGAQRNPAPPSRPGQPVSGSILALDPDKLVFTLSTFIAAALVLVISFEASLPRPWWALLTVYVTAQPMAGAMRPTVLYRLTGVAAGALVTLALVPNLQNSPVLLVLSLAFWTGFCIYLAVLDRTPRAFLFQMASFSSAVMSFPYLYDPSDIFTTTISRVEEMTVAILCVTLVHAILKPRHVRPVMRTRAQSFLSHASRWAAEALGNRHTRLEYELRRRLATDVTELGMVAVHLPFELPNAEETRATVTKLQHRLVELLPLASAAAHRLDRLRALEALDDETAALVQSVIAYLRGSSERAADLEPDLAARCRALAAKHIGTAGWAALLAASLCDRTAEFIDTLHAARRLVRAIEAPHVAAASVDRTHSFSMPRDHGVALMAGFATAVAIVIYCLFWIELAWPSGIATAAFSALITCSFSAQDDPAPAIWKYLSATLATFPLAALYLFVLLPRVDGAGMLIVTLAPALLWMGYLQADPAHAPRALPMLACFIVAMGFLDRFQADFAGFLNTGLAQVGGVVATLAVASLFRSTKLGWTAYRMVLRNWAELAELADTNQPLRAWTWTAHAVDRLGKVATHLANADARDTLHAADGLIDLRVGRNLIQVRRGIDQVQGAAREAILAALQEVATFYQARRRAGKALAGTPSLLGAIDQAIGAARREGSGVGNGALLALVGMRCNLFPNARPLEVAP